MRSFGVNDNNDLFIEGGVLKVVLDLRAVLEICEHCAKAVLGEMIFEPTKGMPYFETVWVGNPTTAPFEAAFRSRILAVPGVSEIEELTTGQSDDKMIYTARIRTIYGTGLISG